VSQAARGELAAEFGNEPALARARVAFHENDRTLAIGGSAAPLDQEVEMTSSAHEPLTIDRP
jgi:hypothetical protein